MAKLPELDYAAEADRIGERLRHLVFNELHRRGMVVAMSGGIDSSCCAALAVRALGKDRVFGLLLPERDSSGVSSRLGKQLAEHLGIAHTLHDITPALEALGCYASQVEALKRTIPEFGPGWKFKLAISDAMGGKVSITKVVAEDPQGQRIEKRLPAADYLQIVAATNFKQRIRKNLEYYHADRLNYVCTGTPNRLEYDQGFFVKNGDGAADVKPIAHLYKTQVYGMARFLGLPEALTTTTPTTDTFSLPQGQDEFYFQLPYPQMDLALWHLNEGKPACELATELGCDEAAAQRIYANILAKRRTTAYLHAAPLLAVPVPGFH
ncbi:MAG: NAD(+) synthase [Sinobacteraceae bacterium]|nr:NAD(+) synthase [Nevskiaceae bacterium]MCP5339970.1 NAD(+) synthase [Nevskiaceae bacterium]MCP5360897.1 NAD(+) synthase [Nevskiaceae bacterium]MCP5467432.1 NAD(+) synthase [Nevskiaceae bacterium]MCP5470752.1 NAD(+) synthase [Nevskiaceae bacterium]